MSNKYNLKITHETLRIGVCDTLEELLVPDKESINCFADIIKWHFLLYFDRYIEIVKKNALTTGSSLPPCDCLPPKTLSLHALFVSSMFFFASNSR